jgi:hypothetical protein
MADIRMCAEIFTLQTGITEAGTGMEEFWGDRDR